MRKTSRRLWALLLCLCLLCVNIAALGEEPAGETAGNPEEDAELLQTRFGQNAEIETDGEGRVVAVNGHPVRTVRAGFNNLGEIDSFQYETDFMDYPFWRDATEYDGNLAVMSLSMAMSANRSLGFINVSEEDFDPSLNVELFLTDAGFTDIRKDDYSKVPTMYTVSTAMGMRKMEAEGEEPFTLIAIGICGGKYKNEWISNLTVGPGNLHEGFRNAAQLVFDRLCGFIAAHGVKGRVKVWVSGFSRAAAVSNLLAGMLNQTGLYRKEDVYAYTFATPAAVKDPPEAGYENIHNIFSPMDLVPQVVPAEWGFGRYGEDLYLCVPEFSSLTGAWTTLERAREDREFFGVENNYSPALNLRMRLLYSILVDMIDSQQNYNDTFQPAITGIMENKTVTHVLSVLRDLMSSLKKSGGTDRSTLDQLMDYCLRVFSASAMRRGFGRADRNTAGMLYRLFGEHVDNSYMSSISAIRTGLFDANDTMYYVMVRGPVTLSVHGVDGEPVVYFSSDGVCTLGNMLQELLEAEDEETQDLLQNMFYFERCGDTTVAAIPGDLAYRVEWQAEKDGQVECLYAQMKTKVTTRYPGARSGKIRVKAGETGTAFVYGEGRQALLPEGFTEGEEDARSLAEFMGIASLGINWRLVLILIGALLAAVLALLLIEIAAHTNRYRGRLTAWIRVLLVFFGIAVLESEIAYWFFADQMFVRTIWKVVAAVCLLLIWFLLHRGKPVLKSFLLPLVTALAADILINYQMIPGVALFLVFHLWLTVMYLRQHPMKKSGWIAWAVISALLSAGIVLLHGASRGAVAWAAAAYAPVLLLMTFSAGRQPGQLRLCATLFLVSDILLGLFFTAVGDPVIHVIYMLLFEMGLLLLASWTDMENKPASVSG